jgi:hypothetical protein
MAEPRSPWWGFRHRGLWGLPYADQLERAWAAGRLRHWRQSGRRDRGYPPHKSLDRLMLLRNEPERTVGAESGTPPERFL